MTQRSTKDSPGRAEIDEQLERILTGRTFVRSARAGRLLRYLAGQALTHGDAQPKEYTLGVDVFDRPETFDPKTDAIVRVQVRRLRDRLADYYETEGRSDKWIIEVPKGYYRVVFRRRPSSPELALPLSGRRNPDAHHLFLEGCDLANEGTPRKLRDAVGRFKSAITLDRGHAAAYSELAHAYVELSSVDCAAHETIPKARKAALKAIELDDELDRPHAVLGLIRLYYDWDRKEARRAAQSAIDRNPSSAYGYRVLACSYTSAAESEKAREAIRFAQQLAPFDAATQYGALWIELTARNYSDVIELGERTQRILPGFVPAKCLSGMARILDGDSEKGLTRVREAAEADPTKFPMTWLQNGCALTGRTSEARELLELLKQGVDCHYVCGYEIAQCYACLEEPDEAFPWFDKAVEERVDCLMWLEVEPWMDPLRSDPRYGALLKESGLAIEFDR